MGDRLQCDSALSDLAYFSRLSISGLSRECCVCVHAFVFTFIIVWVGIDNGVPWWLSGKESTCNVGDVGSVLGLRRTPGEGNGHPLQYSCLGNPRDRGAWRATPSMVSQQSWTRLSD